ncbi:MAG TPA: S8 family serine peptidase [Thermoanaerobaculia bacterium]|nr:S8 family serine peptidase [Thermoanaerobaculia bacterium]
MKRLLIVLLFAVTLGAEPRKYIVEFTAAQPATRAKRFRVEAAEVANVRHEFSRTFNGAAVELREGQSLDALARLPNVAAVYPDNEVIAFAPHPAFGHPLPASGARATQGVAFSAPRGEKVPKVDEGSLGILVAVIDTGIDGTHPALAGKVIGGYDFYNDDADPMDDHRHGTHVAGIIAAQSAEMTGVAPNVRLLAYKVLGADGKGSSSDIIAALEHALDAGADVANLSLGSSGRPDDPVARAVNAAVAAGMVVCVAAGNDEAFHRIGSPAGAANAITVGASTIEEGAETVAYFSSRGPATVSGAIKPDLLAPGRDILSTGLEHGYIVLSGTSMAAPHVSGLAALLLEEHPDWTPERVKAALVTTARAIAEEEVMTQGTGIADLTRARVNQIVALDTHLNFGLDGANTATWSSSKRITIRNDSLALRTIHATITGASAAIALNVTPNQVTLAAGQTAELDVTIAVDHAKLGKPQTRSFAFSGVLSLTSNGEAIRLPWAFLRAGRATIVADGAISQMMWRSDAPKAASPASLGNGSYELLLEPALFDFVIVAQDASGARVVVAEEQRVEGEVVIGATAAHAPHEIRLAGSDASGTPFPDGDGVTTLRSSLVRMVMPDEFSLPLPPLAGRTLHASTFGDRYALLATESFVDVEAARVYVAQYEPLRGVTEDRVLQVTPGDYASQQIEMRFPPNVARREVGIMPRDWPRRSGEFGPMPPSLRFTPNAASWKGTLYFTPEKHEDFASGVQLSMFTAGDAAFPAMFHTPVIRRGEHGFFSMRGFDEKPLPIHAIAGESFVFGGTAVHMPGALQITDSGLFGDVEIYGARGDRRRKDTLTTKIKVFDESNAEVGSASVALSTFFVPLATKGRFRAELKVGAFAFEDRMGEALLTAHFDTNSGATTLAAVTSLAVLDGAGRHATRLPVNGNGALVFSAPVQQVSAFVRQRGRTTWVQLTPVATGDEDPELGLVYRVDLRNALQLGAGEYEIALNLTDTHGNTTTWQLAPAFIAEVMPLGRQRAVRK